ncbi:kinase-like domain-containing protein [Rhizophagus irregularis DAOM 181602=DAOM 197198]|nr:kinase-like domain-containing protein [Rhizophagus irregularis DAOM 181602=DAOM 197198]
MDIIYEGNYFDPMPRLKSSSIPILFVSFNENDNKCIYCGEDYIKAILYLYLSTKNFECTKHGINRIIYESLNIPECCRNHFDILCFKQILTNCFKYKYFITDSFDYNLVDESEKQCKLCGKSFQNMILSNYRLCSDCYLISSGYIESTLTENPIPIIYLSWWHNIAHCDFCKKTLSFTSGCQKYCTNCLIFYTGCRYCLTTNVIFGPTIQSQCKKCKRVLSINFDITKISVGNNDLDDLLSNLRLGIHNKLKITEFADNVNKVTHFNPYNICNIIYHDVELSMEWIPYSQFTNIKEIAKGGFGIIYQATWLDGSFCINKHGSRIRRRNETVILKRFINSKDIDKHFLNELKSNQHCYQIKHHIIKTYGFTKDPELDDYILVMQYANGGDLHKWLQKSFADITWHKKKLSILWQISEGLETIHKANYIHRDFHSGNILFDTDSSYSSSEVAMLYRRHDWKIGDLGLSQPANNTSSNNEIYGVIPYIAPEIFKGSPFSKETDIYCMGMIMWELTTGCKPFANEEHDIQLVFKILDGERPEITEDTPECYANLMKSCWDSDPKKRPPIKKVRNTLGSWTFRNKHIKAFDQAESKRMELINSRKLGPEFSEKPHPNAIFTSRPLSSFISKCSSINSSKDYTSLELELDIDIERSNVLGTKRNIEKLNISSHENNGKRIKFK